MKVKELIEYLEKCNPDLDVYFEEDSPIDEVIEYKSLTNPENTLVSLY